MRPWVGAAVLCAIILQFCVRNLPWHLDDYDQAKQAYVSFEMVEQGHWWLQHTPRQDVATKPPLAGWISAALFSVLRWWEGAWRLPSLASALAILWVLWRSGNQALAGFGGTLAAGAFGLNLMAPRLATLVRTDMLLTLVIFLTGFLIHEKIRTARPWTTRERWLVFLLILASMLTKGPIAYAFLLPGLIGYLVICRWEKCPSFAWCGWWPWVLPLAFFAGWAALGLALDREFYEQVVLREFLGRFDLSEAPVHKHQPVYFYLTHLLRDLLPWSLLLLALPFFKNVRRQLRENRAALWLVCWSLGGLILMSLVPSKRPDRIFPVVPPLCLLLVYMMRDWPVWRISLRQVAACATGVAVVISFGYSAFNVFEGWCDHARALVAFGERVRTQAATGGLRYELVNMKDEGMLLYLHKTRSIKMSEARERWEAGALDALVLNQADFDKSGPRLLPWFIADATGRVEAKTSEYFFVVRSPR